MSDLRFSEDVLEPEPTMGKRLYDYWFPRSFWSAVVISFLVMGLVTITGDTYFVGEALGLTWFICLAVGLAGLMIDGFKEKYDRKT